MSANANQRIIELWEQAVHGDGPHASVIADFAELIVRECADIAKHHVMNISTYADAEFVEEQIGKHFGVEE